MYVSDWMTRKVITVHLDDYLSDAITIMRDKGVKHLPVVKGDKIKGILSDRDIKEFSPSKATTLDIYELHYILANTKIRDLMKTKVFTIAPDAPVEEAAMVMLDRNIGCLPVVEEGRLVGIITERDLLRVAAMLFEKHLRESQVERGSSAPSFISGHANGPHLLLFPRYRKGK